MEENFFLSESLIKDLTVIKEIKIIKHAEPIPHNCASCRNILSMM